MTTAVKKPLTIKIGPHTYRVIEVERLRDANASTMLYGQIRYDKQAIEIEKGLVNTYKRMAVWHEVIHGILETAGIHDHDEQFIDAIASGIVQVLQDNEWLRR